MTVRLLIADDHPVVREGLRGMLAGEAGLEVAGEAADGAEAVRVASETGPDVVLMDLRMPGTDGVEATRLLTELDPAPAVLVITTYDTDNDIIRAVEAGATGYLLKDTPRADLIRAIRAAAEGMTVLAPVAAAKLLNRRRAPAHLELTQRELEVLSLVAAGRTNSEIGRALYIGEATVKTHLLHAFAKLGVDDRTAAVTTAMARGLIRGPRPEKAPPGPSGYLRAPGRGTLAPGPPPPRATEPPPPVTKPLAHRTGVRYDGVGLRGRP